MKRQLIENWFAFREICKDQALGNLAKISRTNLTIIDKIFFTELREKKVSAIICLFYCKQITQFV